MCQIAKSALCILCLMMSGSTACSQVPAEEELRHYPVDDKEGLITQSGTEIDQAISSDGNASLHISAQSSTTVRLYETGDIDVENASLIYRARLRTRDLEGKVYLEMWCRFPEKGEFFSRALQSPLTGTRDWTTQQTPFFLRRGQNPDNVKLNLVIEGTGDVWIDDIHLLKAPLP